MKKNILEERKGKNIVEFLYFSSAQKKMYGKEVVLRAYVYSSDFINRRDNWSMHEKMWIKNRNKTA